MTTYRTSPHQGPELLRLTEPSTTEIENLRRVIDAMAIARNAIPMEGSDGRPIKEELANVVQTIATELNEEFENWKSDRIDDHALFLEFRFFVTTYDPGIGELVQRYYFDDGRGDILCTFCTIQRNSEKCFSLWGFDDS